MKSFILLILLLPWWLPAQSASPLKAPIQTTFSQMPLQQALTRLEKGAEFRFSYNPADLPGDLKVSLTRPGRELGSILDDWFAETALRYRAIGQQVVIYRSRSKDTGATRRASPRSYPTLSGYVVDAESGERLPYAKVWDARTGRGAVSNAFGFFSLTLPPDSIMLMASFPEYVAKPQSRLHTRSEQIEVSLQPYLNLETVSIEADKSATGPEEARMSTITLPVGEVKNMPALLGEVDVVRSIQLMPGVQSGAEGTTGLIVRGGSPDQNLILLDGVPLYYVNHWGGFASVFNADALSDVRLTKGGFPARFGGRLSSVMEVTMKEGNRKEQEFSASIGLLSAKASVQGPIGPKNENGEAATSYILSARRNYFDLIDRGISLLQNTEQGGTPLSYGFYDLNAKINHTFSPKDRLFVSAYAGQDRSRIRQDRTFWNLPDGSTLFGDDAPNGYESSLNDFSETRIRWGNIMGSVRWNHVWGEKAFSNLSVSYSRYRFGTDETYRRTTEERATENTDIRLREAGFDSEISDAILRWEMDWYPTANQQIKWGAQGTLHGYRPGTLKQVQSINETVFQDTVLGDVGGRGMEAFAFVEHDWTIGDRLRINSGLHAAAYRYGEKTYTSLQPRITARAMLAPKLAFKASYARMTQFVHLLVNQSVGLPVDLWVPATDRVAPQNADQLAAGLAWESSDAVWEASLEGYYKQMTNLIDYREGYGYFSSAVEGWENAVETNGTGETYGGELFIRKQKGKLRGWLGYTLSWNWRQFENINQGTRYPFRYDRRHDLSIVAMYTLRPGVELSASWVYGTGQAITLATGRHESLFEDERSFPDPNTDFFDVAGDIFLYEGGRNNQRMRNYHRLDIGASFTKEKPWGSRTWRVGVYNAYGRRNPFYYYYQRQIENGESRTALIQFSLFPATPSLSYSINF